MFQFLFLGDVVVEMMFLEEWEVAQASVRSHVITIEEITLFFSKEKLVKIYKGKKNNKWLEIHQIEGFGGKVSSLYQVICIYIKWRIFSLAI